MLLYEPRTQYSSIHKNYSTTLAPIYLENLIESIRQTPHDRNFIPQEDLDLANKFRTSLFPWRGQFSPELIEIFLNKYSQENFVILDPFLGSGTTLFESIRKGLRCYGSEINPSAIEMSRTAQFTEVPLIERKIIIQETVLVVEKFFRSPSHDLFSYCEEQDISQEPGKILEESCQKIMQETKNKPFVRNIFINALIRYMNSKGYLTKHDFLCALNEHAKIIESLPYSSKGCQVFHSDARSIPLPDNSINLVITSPPYINVFNYHQNNRPAMELTGWNLLTIAKSEIGSNRKHRQNRFLTVVQYALDMLDTLHEMRRLLNANGRAIMVVGRESNVRGASFSNGILVATLAIGGAGFTLDKLQERKFVNRFGETIYEDILHLIIDPKVEIAGDDFARSVAIWHLNQKLNVADKQVSSEVAEAIKSAATVKKSPLFNTLAGL